MCSAVPGFRGQIFMNVVSWPWSNFWIHTEPGIVGSITIVLLLGIQWFVLFELHSKLHSYVARGGGG